MKWKMLSKLPKKTTVYCKSCFEEIRDYNFHSIFNYQTICNKCLNISNPQFIKFKILNYDALYIYNYDENQKEKFLLYKQYGDYELKDYFIKNYLIELKIKFHDYIVLPAPSYIDRDKKRGYNPIIEILRDLNLKIDDCFVKTKNIEQKKLSFKERENIGNFIEIKKDNLIKGNKVLIVDDLITSGSTIKALIKLTEKEGPKDIKILTIAKTINENK